MKIKKAKVLMVKIQAEITLFLIVQFSLLNKNNSSLIKLKLNNKNSLKNNNGI